MLIDFAFLAQACDSFLTTPINIRRSQLELLDGPLAVNSRLAHFGCGSWHDRVGLGIGALLDCFCCSSSQFSCGSLATMGYASSSGRAVYSALDDGKVRKCVPLPFCASDEVLVLDYRPTSPKQQPAITNSFGGSSLIASLLIYPSTVLFWRTEHVLSICT